MEKTGCLIRCHGEHCSSSQCCSKEKFIEDSCSDPSVKKQVAQSITKKFEKKEIIPSSTTIDLKRFTVHDHQIESSNSCQSIVENSPDGSSCQPKDQVPSNKDNAIDSVNFCAINVVDINDEKTGNGTPSNDEQSSAIAS